MDGFAIELEGASSVSGLAVSADGTRIAVVLWSVVVVLDASGRELVRAALDPNWEAHVAFAADGTVLAGQGHTVTLLAPGAEPVSVVGKFDGHKSPIAALAEVAPGFVVTGHHDGALRRVDLAARKFARTGFEAHGGRAQAIAVGTTPGSFWTSGSRLLAERHVDDRAPRRQRSLTEHPYAIDPARGRALAVTARQQLCVVSIDEVAPLPLPASASGPVCAFAADGTLALAIGDDVLVLDPKEPDRATRHPGGHASALTIAGDWLWIARGRRIERLPLRARPPVVRRELRPRHYRGVAQLLRLPEGFGSVGSGVIKRWSLDGRWLGTLRHERGGIRCACVIGDGKELLLGTERAELVVCDLATGEPRESVRLAGWPLSGVAAPADGAWIAGLDLGGERARFARGKTRAKWRATKRAQQLALVWSEAARALIVVGEMSLLVLDEDGRERATVPVASMSPRVAISDDGALFAVSALDAVELRPLGEPEVVVARCPMPGEGYFALAWAGAELWVARGTELARFSREGARTATVSVPDEVLALLPLAADRLAIGTRSGEVRVVEVG